MCAPRAASAFAAAIALATTAATGLGCTTRETVAVDLTEIRPPGAASLILAIDDGDTIEVTAIDLAAPAMPSPRMLESGEAEIEALFYSSPLSSPSIDLEPGYVQRVLSTPGRAVPDTDPGSAFVTRLEDGALSAWAPLTERSEALAGFRIAPARLACSRYRVLDTEILATPGEVNFAQFLEPESVIVGTSSGAVFVTHSNEAGEILVRELSVAGGVTLHAADGFAPQEMRVTDAAGRIGRAHVSGGDLEIAWFTAVPEPGPLVAIDGFGGAHILSTLSSTGAVWSFEQRGGPGVWTKLYTFSAPLPPGLGKGGLKRTDRTTVVARPPEPYVFRHTGEVWSMDPTDPETPLILVTGAGPVGFIAAGANGLVYLPDGEIWRGIETGLEGPARAIHAIAEIGYFVGGAGGVITEILVGLPGHCEPIQVAPTTIVDAVSLDWEWKLFVLVGERTAAGIPVVLIERTTN